MSPWASSGNQALLENPPEIHENPMEYHGISHFMDDSGYCWKLIIDDSPSFIDDSAVFIPMENSLHWDAFNDRHVSH